MSQDILTAISDAVGTEVFGIWFLIGAALVFFMQAGFAMVEAGFTRAKNAGNIITVSYTHLDVYKRQDSGKWKVREICH